jgi:hypothetical protein
LIGGDGAFAEQHARDDIARDDEEDVDADVSRGILEGPDAAPEGTNARPWAGFRRGGIYASLGGWP